MIELGAAAAEAAEATPSVGVGEASVESADAGEVGKINDAESLSGTDYEKVSDKGIEAARQNSLSETIIENDAVVEQMVREGGMDKDADAFFESPESETTEEDGDAGSEAENAVNAEDGATSDESVDAKDAGATGESERQQSTEGAEPKEGESKLTEEQRNKIKEETGWSDEVIDHIENMEQYEILKNAGLKEQVVDGKICLVKENIDLDYVDPKTGMTNRERMEKGRPPIDPKTGEKIELHHLGQDRNGPLVELTQSEHRGPENHAILHPETSGSWRHEEGSVQEFDQERQQHWQERAKENQ